MTESSDDPVFGDTVLRQLPPSHLAASQVARTSWESRREFELASQVLAGEATLADYRFYQVAEQLIGQELSLVPAKPENVLFIGSGPLPLTAVLIHQRTGAHVTCVDCDPEAIAQSSRLLSKLSLDQALRVSCGYGDQIPACRFDLVVIAAPFQAQGGDPGKPQANHAPRQLLLVSNRPGAANAPLRAHGREPHSGL